MRHKSSWTVVQSKFHKKLPAEVVSALGQKRTYVVQQPMSALLSIATAKADSRKRPCPLYPRKRTCAVQ